MPLPLRSPAWGVMILERASGNPFTTDELSLATEFGRLAAQAVEEADASMRCVVLPNLTRSPAPSTAGRWTSG